MLTLDRLNAAIAAVAVKVAALDAQAASDLDSGMALVFEDHFEFQRMQAAAHADGIMSTDAAALIYRALGESGSTANGRWAAHTDTATKVVVTQLMSELLERRMKRRRKTFAA